MVFVEFMAFMGARAVEFRFSITAAKGKSSVFFAAGKWFYTLN